MKRILLAGIVVMASLQAIGQNIYKTNFSNSPSNRIEIQAASDDVQIIGHDSDEIIIETTVKPGSSPVRELPVAPTPPFGNNNEDRGAETNERAQGLKPLTASGSDNTGIGLTIKKTDNQFTVMNIAHANVTGQYVFKIPNKVKLTINEIKHWASSSFKITGIQGELNVNALNSAFVIKEVTGPVIMQNTNGSIDITYDKLAPEKPNSLTAVNGFIDITLPVDVKTDININAINGKAFTDFDIKVNTEDNKGSMPPISHMRVFNLQGSINGGGVPFTVSAVNGDVYIRKEK